MKAKKARKDERERAVSLKLHQDNTPLNEMKALLNAKQKRWLVNQFPRYAAWGKVKRIEVPFNSNQPEFIAFSSKSANLITEEKGIEVFFNSNQPEPIASSSRFANLITEFKDQRKSMT